VPTVDDDASRVPLTWPIAEEVRQTMRIRWPSHYGWANAENWMGPIRTGIAAHIPIENADLAQPVGNVVVFEAAVDGTVRRVAVDYDDKLDLNACASEVDLYFKLQYRRDGYDNPAVRPGGYVSPHMSLYRHANRWRALRDASPPSLDVLGRFGLKWAQAIRGQAIAMLRDQDRFQFEGGAASVWWGEHMDEICSARVCIDLPGHGEFCYRLVEYLAVGACVVGPELAAEMPVPLQSEVHLVRVPRSLEGLVEWCERLVTDTALRTSIQRHAVDYFDRYLALPQLGGYYVDRVWQTLR
jgi:hypothetical protein